MVEKAYNSATGVDQFYYGVLTTGKAPIAGTAPKRVKFLQDIEVSMTSTIVRAYGDNTTAELAVSQGNVTVSGNFHKLLQTDKNVILGLETTLGGLSGHGSNDNPPYVGVVFSKTYEDGSTEYVGLPKGKFLKTNITGASKQGETKFTQDAIAAEFMDRTVDGFDDDKSVITGVDAKGAVAARDAIFMAVFGVAHPDAIVIP